MMNFVLQMMNSDSQWDSRLGCAIYVQVSAYHSLIYQSRSMYITLIYQSRSMYITLIYQSRSMYINLTPCDDAPCSPRVILAPSQFTTKGTQY